MGYVRSVGDLDEISTKAGKMLKKKVLTLIDDSNSTIELTLWAQKAENFNQVDCVIAVNAVKVSDFNGRSISTSLNSEIEINPSIYQATELEKWHSSANHDDVEPLSKRGAYKGNNNTNTKTVEKTFGQVMEEGLGRDDQPAFFANIATITKVYKGNNMMYSACPKKGCNKKVQSLDDKWYCENCNAHYDECEWRYILKALASDNTGSQRIDFFNDKAEVLMGCSAKEVHDLQFANDPSFESKFKDAEFSQFYMRYKASTKVYQDIPRFQVQIMAIYPLDFNKCSKKLINLIERYEKTF